MKIDLYTKTALTGILGCLVWLCVMHSPIATPLQAQLGPTSVIVAGYSGAGGTHGIDGGLPVRTVGGTGNASTVPMPLTRTPAPAAVAPTSQAAPAYSGTEATSTRCQAITQKGTQCKRNAKAGSNYCLQHGG
jgi:hypothetical protein